MAVIGHHIPPCVAKNGMSFPAKPDFFYLNGLEWRMLAPRLAFQKLLQAPRGNQLKIKGNLVNVLADVNNTVNMLPRLPQESRIVQVKRRLEYKSSAAKGTFLSRYVGTYLSCLDSI